MRIKPLNSVMALIAAIIITGGVVYADISRGNQTQQKFAESQQHQHKFSDIFLALKPGDQVNFLNRDGVTHKLVSTSPDFVLDNGELRPGTSKALEFDHKGVVDLSCSLHPEMKMTIFVRSSPPLPVPETSDTGTLRTNIYLLSAS